MSLSVMINPEPSPDKFLELAKRTLGFPASSRNAIPYGYLDELRKHYRFSKDDTFFYIYPHQGDGYGRVICLEKGCDFVSINLTSRAGEGDNGLGSGIGSLTPYRLHAEKHPTHKANRCARVNAIAENKEANHIKVAPHPAHSSEDYASAKRGLQHATNNLPTLNGLVNTTDSIMDLHSSSPSRYHSEYSPSSSSPMIPMKRSFSGDDTDITIPSSSPHNPYVKRRKEEQVNAGSSQYLPTVARNLITSADAAAGSAPAGSHVSHTDTSLEKELYSVRTLLGNYLRVTRKEDRHWTQIEKLGKQLQDLEAAQACGRNALLSNTTGIPSGISSSFVQLPNSMAVEPYGSGPAASNSNAQLMEMVVEPYGSGPAASNSNARFMEMDVEPYGSIPAPSDSETQLAAMYVKPFSSNPATSASSSQHVTSIPSYGADSARGMLNTKPQINLNAMSAASSLPNYGDTMDCESEDDTHGDMNYPSASGPVADRDIDKFLIEAGDSGSFDGNESVDKALAKLGLKKLGEQLPLMKIALMPHQVIGVAWMLEHEQGTHKGGILADEMGLGKTVQMISTMLQHRSDDPAVKSTLICVPVTLLDQWKLEIETKTDGAFSCLIYHGSNKPKHEEDLREFDVVLTTFKTLALEWPDNRAAEKKKKKDGDDFIQSDSETEKKVKKKGLLLRTKWFRVVLDEAQNIRNRNTRVSNAVTYVEATYRWCLTGTPVTNALADCYAFMRFLQIRPWYNWKGFNDHIAKLEKYKPDVASSRLQVILNGCSIRRNKDSVLDGKKLIELPPKNVVLQQLRFSQDERNIYNAIEKSSQATFNSYLREGTVVKNYSQIFVLLLRLRQLCSHPCLIQEDGDATVKHQSQTELGRATVLAGEEFVRTMKAKFKAIALERMAAEKASTEVVIEAEDCPVCFDTLTHPVVTRCCHVFCGECIDTIMNQPMEDTNGSHYAMSERPCPTCMTPIQREMIFHRKAFEPTDADLEGEQSGPPIIVDDDDNNDQLSVAAEPPEETKKPQGEGKGKGKGRSKKQFTRRLPDPNEDYDDSLSNFTVESEEDAEETDARRELKRELTHNRRIDLDSDEESNESDEAVVRKRKGKAVQRFLPSTKMKEMMRLLKMWAEAEETKDDKTLVLSQWTSYLDLIADYLDENGFTFIRYQGDMSRSAKDKAVRIFMSREKARIMLMSLKGGGVGLNLARANRVISMDLGWSSAVENQAFDRVHRLGQVRPVMIQRLVIEDTVEARILALQQRKQNLADGSLGEGTGKKLGRLSVKDLANLFGLNGRGQLL